jgi:membrane protein required for colicin V production
VGGFILATYFGSYVAGLLPERLQPLWSALIGFLIIFAVVLLVGWIVSMALSSAVRASGLAPADRALGLLFGVVRGLLVVLVIVLLAGLTPLPRERFWRDAFLSGPFETAALALRPHLPAHLGQHLKYR